MRGRTPFPLARRGGGGGGEGHVPIERSITPHPPTSAPAGYYSFLNTASPVPGNASQDLEAVQEVIAFLTNSPPEPFCVFISGIGAHPPYGAPEPYYSMYDPQTIARLAPLPPLDIPGKPGYYGNKGIRGYRNLTSLNETFFYDINAKYLG